MSTVTPIIEAILSDSTGAYVRFRWHAEPCPRDNTQVAIFKYTDTGEYISSTYVRRPSARREWDKMVKDGYSIIREAEKV